jgi:PAS domain S-box-containing protein
MGSRTGGRKRARRAPPRKRAGARAARTVPGARELAALFLDGPVAAAVANGERVLRVNRAFARALGREAAECEGRAVAELLPPEGSALPVPGPGESGSYRTRLDGVSARVDVGATLVGRRPLVSIVVRPVLDDRDSAQSRALLALSRELAAARDEEELSAALAHALDVLFPGRSFCIRLVDSKTLALTALYARGRFRASARERIALRQGAVKKTGLSVGALQAGGLVVTEIDEPVFEGCDRATAVPLTVSGALFGVVNVEFATGAPGDPEEDEPLLLQVTNQAALAVRNLRSLEEVTYLKGFLEDLIENANALIMVVNREREVIVFNRALSRLLGRPREEVLGEELAALVPDADRDRVEALLDRAFDGQAATGVELRLALAGGAAARVAANTSAIYGASGEVEGVMVIGQDQTLLHALQDRAEQAQKLAEIGRLAAGIVHELNNPLTAVTAYADALVTKLSAANHDPADVEKLRRILEAGQRIHRFSRDLIAYARPARDEMELVDLTRLVQQAAQMCEPVLRSASARIEQRLEPVPPVWGVRGSLLQVFVNLVTNAAHALEPNGGTVTLELAPAGDHVAARVKDDGQGMQPDVKRRAFEPFFTTKPDGQGSGLGLSIVQGIVSRHRGAITVESVPGQGTTFTVMLPVKPGAA